MTSRGRGVVLASIPDIWVSVHLTNKAPFPWGNLNETPLLATKNVLASTVLFPVPPWCPFNLHYCKRHAVLSLSHPCKLPLQDPAFFEEKSMVFYLCSQSPAWALVPSGHSVSIYEQGMFFSPSCPWSLIPNSPLLISSPSFLPRPLPLSELISGIGLSFHCLSPNSSISHSQSFLWWICCFLPNSILLF